MKKFKTKKKINFKNKILIMLIIILFIFFFILMSFNKLNKNHDNFVNVLLAHSFNHSNSFALINKLSSKLDYLLKTSDFFDKKEVLYNDNPRIYLYNSNSNEEYKDKNTVKDASKILQNNLKKLGINALVESQNESNFFDIVFNNSDISEKFLNKVKEKYSSIKYFINIHRDSLDSSTITINNKKYAKILFVLELDNPYYKENKAILEKMIQYLDKYYPGVTKGILERNVNDVYNQDINKNIILMEIGGINNNINEVNNSTEIIALMIYDMLGDENEKSS